MDDKSIARRKFLTAGGTVAAGGLAATLVPAGAVAADKKVRIAAMSDLKTWTPMEFEFPEGEPALLVDIGKAVEGGIGPNGSIVAYSTLCQHMGCPLNFDSDKNNLTCGCHASVFDPARSGMAIEGPATRGLPRIALTIEDGVVFAVGVAEGLVYGHACDA